MTKKIFILLLGIVIFITPKAFANPTITSESAILMEAETGQILFDKNSDVKQYPASITKVLTAIIAMENNKLEDKVIVGKDVPYQIEADSSAIYLLPEEELTMEQLMYALLVESANDAAVTIAEHTSGSVEEFAKLMNAKAKELGATNSNFVNPNGLHNDEHYTTAHDMALIMREAIKNPTLLKFMTTINYVIPETNKQQTRYLWTKNKLFKYETNEFFYDKVIASKTGYTTKSKNTLVSAAEDNGMQLITVVLRSNGAEAYRDTLSMFHYGFDNFEASTLIHQGDFLKEQQVKDATGPLKIVSRGTVKYIKNKEDMKEVASNIKISENLTSSINEGDKIGTVDYIVDDQTIGTADLVAGNQLISESAVRRNKILTFLAFVIFGLMLLYIIARIYVYYRNMKIKRRRVSKHAAYGKKIRRRSNRNEYFKY